jgi:hypothetical protein
MTDDRVDLLERYGREYGQLRLAIGWTEGIDGPAAKISKRWQSRPDRLADAEHGAGIFRRGLTRNPVVSLKASGLIGVDVDGEAGHGLCRKLVRGGFPVTVSVRSGRPDGGVHLWFRPAEGISPAKIEFSADGLKISSDGYLVIPPAIHETGTVYEFVQGRAPWDIPIATLPAATCRRLTDGQRKLDDAARSDDQSPVAPGNRHRHLLRVGCAMRRAGARHESIEAALLLENELRCEPPKGTQTVRELARDITLRYPPGARG